MAWGANAIVTAVSPKFRKQQSEEFLKARAEQRIEAEEQGANMAQFDAQTKEITNTIEKFMPIFLGVIGAGLFAGGTALGWSGYRGFFPAQVVQ